MRFWGLRALRARPWFGRAPVPVRIERHGEHRGLLDGRRFAALTCPLWPLTLRRRSRFMLSVSLPPRTRGRRAPLPPLAPLRPPSARPKPQVLRRLSSLLWRRTAHLDFCCAFSWPLLLLCCTANRRLWRSTCPDPPPLHHSHSP